MFNKVFVVMSRWSRTQSWCWERFQLIFSWCAGKQKNIYI